MQSLFYRENDGAPEYIKGISLLTVSKKVHIEAQRALYTTRKIHYTVDVETLPYSSPSALGMPTDIYRTIHHIQHISINLEGILSYGVQDQPMIDGKVAQHLELLFKLAPRLRSLTLHVLGTPYTATNFNTALAHILQDSSMPQKVSASAREIERCCYQLGGES